VTRSDKTNHRTLGGSTLHPKFWGYCDSNLEKRIYGTSVRWWVLSDRVTCSTNFTPKGFPKSSMRAIHSRRTKLEGCKPLDHLVAPFSTSTLPIIDEDCSTSLHTESFVFDIEKRGTVNQHADYARVLMGNFLFFSPRA